MVTPKYSFAAVPALPEIIAASSILQGLLVVGFAIPDSVALASMVSSKVSLDSYKEQIQFQINIKHI
jgi:hypothetical protein